MKHRILSLLLALVLTIGMIPAVAAAETTSAKDAADKLNAMGLFSGTGTNPDGTPNYDLERSPTRQEAITMLVKLVGGADEAGKGGWKTPFTDVDDWAKNWVGYAYNKNLTSGTSATTFGANDKVTAAQYLTFLLKALGYDASKDFSWDKAWELSDQIGMTAGQYNAQTTTFTRGDMAILSYTALSTNVKGQDVSLAKHISSASQPDPKPTTFTAANYAYMVSDDFRYVKAQYSAATPLAGYVHAYTSEKGEQWVVTMVMYSIISTYNLCTLHNLTTGQTIRDAGNHYQELAARAKRSGGIDGIIESMNYTMLAVEAKLAEGVCLRGIGYALINEPNPEKDEYDAIFVPASQM